MAKKSNKSLFSTIGFKFLLVVTIATLFTYGLKYLSETNVLGTSTYLADKGSDSVNGNDSSGSSSDSESNNNGSQQNNSTEQSNRSQDTSGEKQHAVEPTETPEPTEIPQHDFKSLNSVVFDTENHGKMRLGKSEVQISSEDGHFSIKAKSENGTEIQLENDSLSKINQELESEDIEISTDSAGFHIRHGKFEAQTHFPLSINPTTNKLTITTPGGTKTVAVLPDQAVNNLINLKFITVVASNSADTGIDLTEFKNQPAFEVQGKSIQKLFGFFPIGIDKTGIVSAETGQVLQVNQSLLSRIFDLLSVE